MKYVHLLQCTLLISLIWSAGVVSAIQPVPLGLFDGTGDVGPVKHEGAVSYDTADQTYTICGSGANMWAHNDEFHFAWKELAGDFILTADMAVAKRGQAFVVSGLDSVELPDEVHVGLFVCSHNADVVETARFTNVRITRPAPEDLVPYRQYIGCRLEVMDVATCRRRVLHTVADSLQAPNWTRDGKALVYNRNDRWDIYKIRADGSGNEIRLTTHQSLQDGAEFAPDGKHVFYNSS